MKRTVFLFVFLARSVGVAQLPPVTSNVTAEGLDLAVADVSVAKIDFVLPVKQTEAEGLLSHRFFNQSVEQRYRGLTTEQWNGKWQLFADALVTKAKQTGLDAKNLKQALRSLNKGRNLQTALWPLTPVVIDKFGLSPEQERSEEAFRQKAEEKYQLALKARERNPGPYYNNHLALIPVGAYLAKHAKGECWLIVCKWENTDERQPMPLGHIMIWAIDTKSGAVVAYVTCD